MIRYSTVVAADAVEDALDRLLPLIPAGVHERPAGDGVELAWYDEIVPPPGLEVVAEPAPDDPHARRRRFAAAWTVGGRFAIRAPDAPAAAGGLQEIVVEADRGQFGTGAHPTTSDSLELLLTLEPRGALADLGCGAGVLAVAAAMLGFSPVTAVDFEPGSVRATAENARRNGVDVRVDLADLLREPPPAAATVVANVPLPVHLAVAERLQRDVRAVIVSGVVAEEADAAVAAYALRPARRRDTAGWATILLERP